MLKNTPYCTRSKSLATLRFVRRKSSVQVDANCDEFLVSLPLLVPLCSKDLKDTSELLMKVSKHCTCMYCSAYRHKQMLHTYPPCYQLLVGKKIIRSTVRTHTSLQTSQPRTAVRTVNWNVAIKASNASNHYRSNEPF